MKPSRNILQLLVAGSIRVELDHVLALFTPMNDKTHLSWVEKAERVNSPLDGLHKLHSAKSEFLDKITLLSDANTMFPSAWKGVECMVKGCMDITYKFLRER